MTTLNEILDAKADAGYEAFLWLHSSGDCILWRNESDSINDDGKNAVGRWHVSDDVADELIASGEVDDVA